MYATVSEKNSMNNVFHYQKLWLAIEGIDIFFKNLQSFDVKVILGTIDIYCRKL